MYIRWTFLLRSQSPWSCIGPSMTGTCLQNLVGQLALNRLTTRQCRHPFWMADQFTSAFLRTNAPAGEFFNDIFVMFCGVFITQGCCTKQLLTTQRMEVSDANFVQTSYKYSASRWVVAQSLLLSWHQQGMEDACCIPRMCHARAAQWVRESSILRWSHVEAWGALAALH